MQKYIKPRMETHFFEPENEEAYQTLRLQQSPPESVEISEKTLKLKDYFLTQATAEGQMMVAADPSAFPGIIESNQTAAFIVDLLKTEVSRERIEQEMSDRYGVPAGNLREDVSSILQELKKLDAFEIKHPESQCKE